MLNLHSKIKNKALLNEITLLCCLTSLVIIIPKDSGQQKIHRLRIINMYELDYTLVLKFFWPKTETANAKRHNWLGCNQNRERKEISAIETVTLNELIINYHRRIHNSLCINQDDAAGCFDRIITNHTILNSRKFHIPSNIRKVHYEI